MKDATRKAAKKAAAKKAPAKRAVAKKSAGPDRVGAAREALGAIAERESVGVTVDVEKLAIAVLSHICLVKIDPVTGKVTPFGLLSRTFNDPLVGLEDNQMVGFYEGLILAIGNNERVATLIRKNLLTSPSADLVIIDVTNLIQTWVNSPEVVA